MSKVTQSRTIQSLINDYEDKEYISGSIALVSALVPQMTFAQVGKPYIHDPSTIMEVTASTTPSEPAVADLYRKTDGLGTAAVYAPAAVPHLTPSK